MLRYIKAPHAAYYHIRSPNSNVADHTTMAHVPYMRRYKSVQPEAFEFPVMMDQSGHRKLHSYAAANTDEERRHVLDRLLLSDPELRSAFVSAMLHHGSTPELRLTGPVALHSQGYDYMERPPTYFPRATAPEKVYR